MQGLGRPVRGTCGSGSTDRVSVEVPRRQWVRRTNIPTVETSPENFLLSMESVCSQAIPGFGSSCQWEPVGTKNELVAVSVMTNVLKLRGVSTKLSKWLRRLVTTSGGTLSSVDRLQKYVYTVEAQGNIVS